MRIKEGYHTKDDFYRMVNDKQPKEKRENKYNAVKVETPQETFDSKTEYQMILWLQNLEQQGKIENLVIEKAGLRWALEVNGWRVADYEADARFTPLQPLEFPTMAGKRMLDAGHQYVVDRKSEPTRKKDTFRMKKILMRALHNIEILEV